MKLGLWLGYEGKHVQLPIALIKEAEAAGYDSVWVAEAYGSDAVSISAWILANTDKINVGTAIMQMPARTPAMAAMTAMTLSQLSGNRFKIGLGASGPQVVEGWHGVPYGKPVTRLREYITIMRKIMARDEPVSFAGEMYQLPWQGEGATGLGKPLKSILAATPDIPIYSASFTPNGLAASAEVADGVFPIWLSPEKTDLLEEHLQKGFAKRTDNKTRSEFDVAPPIYISIGHDLAQCRQPVKEHLALYIGGMGAREKNFYNDYTKRMGYEEEAVKIQDLYLAGNKAEAAATVPDELVDEISLVGPLERITERAEAWKTLAKQGKIGTVLIKTAQPEYLNKLAEILLS